MFHKNRTINNLQAEISRFENRLRVVCVYWQLAKAKRLQSLAESDK